MACAPVLWCFPAPSTGENEALELRDGGPRYLGKGVLQAVKNIQEVIAPKLGRLDPGQQAAIDQLLCELDGTCTKSRLGADAVLAVSMAVARAGAALAGLRFLSRYLGARPRPPCPCPC